MYLEKIVANKRIEIEELKKKISINELKQSHYYNRTCYSLKANLLSSHSGIISEFKRKSPSKGFIKEGAKVSDIVPFYQQSGASGLSILADKDFFAGSPEDIKTARPMVTIPILYKEFIVDEFQIHLAKSCGADVVLLIAAVLSPKEVLQLTQVAHSLGMEVLLELHSEDELAHICPDTDLVGINNRNLKTFVVDLKASIDLCHKIPDTYVKISESGISNPQTVKELRAEGFRGFLMGENFMKTENPAETLKNFIAAL